MSWDGAELNCLLLFAQSVGINLLQTIKWQGTLILLDFVQLHQLHVGQSGIACNCTLPAAADPNVVKIT